MKVAIYGRHDLEIFVKNVLKNTDVEITHFVDDDACLKACGGGGVYN